jgi:hypothetical protein
MGFVCTKKKVEFGSKFEAKRIGRGESRVWSIFITAKLDCKRASDSV